MTKRPTVSAVLIVKNEEHVLEACLESVRWADEIVVYDTGSVDGTRQIARRFTDKVVDGYWDDDFAAARNRALRHATSEWVLSIDADEVFESQGSTLRKHLRTLGFDVYGLRIKNVSSNPLAAPYEFTAPRIFRREGYRFRDRLHEQICTDAGETVAAYPLLGIRLVHSGYADRVRVETEKADRNIAIVLGELDAAERAGDLKAVAVARVHRVRSLSMAHRDAEAGALAEEAWDPDRVPNLVAESLASNQFDVALRRGDLEAAQKWIDRWRSVMGPCPGVLVGGAQIAVARGEFAAALDLLDRLPTVSSDAVGGEFRRDSVAAFEVRVLCLAGRVDEAFELAVSTIDRRRGIFAPPELLGLFGADRFGSLLRGLDDRQWRDWAMRCVEARGPDALVVLRLMADDRRGDATACVCAANLVDQMTLAEAGEWSARLRAFGLGDYCTLLAFAGDERRSPRERALAASLVVSAHHDERGLALLEMALARVPAAEEPDLARELEIVAPGLVSLGV